MRIGFLTKINPVMICCANCQEQLNEALDIVVAEVKQEDNTSFQNYGITIVETNYEVQIKPSKPSTVAGRNYVETNTLS
eukprot:4744345-Ditylum_brightwellii.AAC.1